MSVAIAFRNTRINAHSRLRVLLLRVENDFFSLKRVQPYYKREQFSFSITRYVFHLFRTLPPRFEATSNISN